jgi:nicotinate-nucleotide adenylyltransferase
LAAKRIGILGGTFDPIHIGHLIIASEFRAELELSEVRFVPAGDPPHKPEQRLSPVANRLRMIELAIEQHAEFAIDRVELERTGPSYTKDTLALLKQREPAACFVFLMGADSLRDLSTWRDPTRILELAELGVAARPDVAVDLDAVVEALPNARGRITTINVPLIGISSREIRQRVATGRPISFLVPATVERFILDQGLYRSAYPSDDES